MGAEFGFLGFVLDIYGKMRYNEYTRDENGVEWRDFPQNHFEFLKIGMKNREKGVRTWQPRWKAVLK